MADMGTVSMVRMPAWHLDPFAPGRRRLWDGSAWSALVVGSDGEEAISWRPELSDLAPPISTLPEPIVAAAPPMRALPSPGAGPELAAMDALTPTAVPELAGLDPVAMAFGGDAEEAPWKPAPSYPTVSHRRRLVPALVVVGVLSLAAGAGAGVLQQPRPTEEPTLLYRDQQAGFTLRYPDAWHRERPTPGARIRFVVGGRAAAASSTNAVSVEVNPQRSPLLSLDAEVSQVTEGARTKHPSIRLDEASHTTLAHGSALRMRFTVLDTTPPISLLVVHGLTTDGRQLTVTITIREPRTAPSDREIERFLASITPA